MLGHTSEECKKKKEIRKEWRHIAKRDPPNQTDLSTLPQFEEPEKNATLPTPSTQGQATYNELREKSPAPDHHTKASSPPGEKTPGIRSNSSTTGISYTASQPLLSFGTGYYGWSGIFWLPWIISQAGTFEALIGLISKKMWNFSCTTIILV